MDSKLLTDNYFNEAEKLFHKHWVFLIEPWPIITNDKYHRTETKEVKSMAHVRSFVQDRLGIVPVFFFLTKVFPIKDYPGPYRNIEKGLLIIYHLLTGRSIDDMEQFIPKSSYYDIHKNFYITQHDTMDKCISKLLCTMFSSIKLRLFSAMKNNPKQMKQVTMHLDGHDTRASYVSHATSSEMYSFKLKKSGFRTQVITDANNMILYVSKSQPCKDYNDGTMFLDMKIDRKIDPLDCVACDGGYPLFIAKYLETSEVLNDSNFCYPIRKARNVELTSQEKEYNKYFGSFRSRIEGTFGELGTTFERFNNKAPIRVTDINTFTLQLKLACLLLNIKTFCKTFAINPEPHNSLWLKELYEYPGNNRSQEFTVTPTQNLNQKVMLSQNMLNLQKEFLGLIVDDADESMCPDNSNQVLKFSHIEIPSLQ